MKTTIIEANLETGESKITKDGMIFNGTLGLIQSQYIQLCEYRDDGRVPSEHLLDDIKVYAHILESENREQLAEDYLRTIGEMREETKSFSIRKMEAAKKLGWF